MGARMQTLFQIAAAAVSLYATLCFVRIIITWIPRAQYSGFGRFLSSLCDPYMNLFSRLPLRIGGLDFSPMISIGLLSLLSSILGNTAQTGRIYIGGILSYLVVLIWSVFSSLVAILLIAVIIRYFVLIFSRSSTSYNSVWSAFDNALSSIVFKISSLLAGKNPMSYKKALGLTILELIVALICGRIIIQVIIGLLVRIPF